MSEENCDSAYFCVNAETLVCELCIRMTHDPLHADCFDPDPELDDEEEFEYV
jgi:hypothetical protein